MFEGKVRGVRGIWEKGRTKKTRGKVTLIHDFKTVARYKRTFNYFQHAKFVVDRYFNSELTNAIKSAR